MDDFKLSDLDQPLYEHSQVITAWELKAFAQELYYLRMQAPWWNPVYKWSVDIAMGTVMGLLQWIVNGKSAIKDSKGDRK